MSWKELLLARMLDLDRITESTNPCPKSGCLTMNESALEQGKMLIWRGMNSRMINRRNACFWMLTVLTLFCTESVHAQAYANHWYFGNQWGLDFASGQPVYDSTNSTSVIEAIVSISDQQGNLQFYYGGDSVVTVQHTQMVNGDKIGGPDLGTVTQFFTTAQPDSAHRYYVFTPTHEFPGPINKFRYSVIDMSKQGGLGEVVVKDCTLIESGHSEMVHGVKAGNAGDVWVTTVRRDQNFSQDTLVTYRLTNSGISAPVKSLMGDPFSASGLIKFSPGGEYLLAGPKLLNDEHFVLYQFNSTTGAFSNPITIDVGPSVGASGGRAFSCDATKMYLNTPGSLYQFDLTTYDSLSIANSKVLLASGGFSYNFGYMQLGPDQKIYGLLAFADSMMVINQPNQAGAAADYHTGGPPQQPGVPDPWSLTAFEPTCLCSPFIWFESNCFNDSTEFELRLSAQVDSAFWDFGDPGSGLANADTGISPIHVFSSAGTFTVQAIYYRAGLPDTADVQVEILSYPTVDLGPDTSICAGDSVQLDVTQSQMSYLWDNDSTDAFRTVHPIDTVWVTVSNVCDTVSDTLIVDTVLNFSIDLGPDTLLCPGDSILLTAYNPNSTYNWNQGSTNDSIWVTAQGSYSVLVDAVCFVQSDTILVDSLPVPTVYLGSDTVLCEGDTIFVQTNTAQVNYLWQDSSTVADYTVLTPDTFWVTVSNLCGQAADTIVIDSLIPALVIFPDDSILCAGDTVVLDATIQLGTYTWHDNSTNSMLSATQTGIYWAEAVNSCGTSSDTVFLDFLNVPAFDLGADTVLCAGDSIQLQASSYLSSYSWENASTDSVRWINQGGTYSLTVTNQCFSATDSITIQGIDIPNFSLGPDTFLCQGYSGFLLASGDLATFLWHDGSTDSVLSFNSGGQKWGGGNECLRNVFGYC